MQCLFKNARITDPQSEYHGQTLDLLVRDGKIVEVNQDITAADVRVIEAKGLHLSPGRADVGTNICDPGYEHREDAESAAAAAAAGGFTTLLPQPNTLPVIQSKSEINYLHGISRTLPVTLHPVGALSADTKGENITEMTDMHTAGAVAFSDGQKSVQSGGLLLRALQYVKAFDGIIVHRPHDRELARGGQIHEGYVSTSLGLRGLPVLAEETMIKRDIALAEYADSRLHLSDISSKAAVNAVKEAKRKGLKITASVAVMNLLFTDANLTDFNTNFKVMPPLRDESDRKALIKGLKDGTIDFVTTNHTPLEPEHKELEFTYADFGAINLQSAFGMCLRYLPQFSLEEWTEKWTINPRKIFNLPPAKIAVGEVADLTAYLPEESFILAEKDILSKSKNSPVTGEELKGRTLATVNGEALSLFF